jgi:hypothetical protein
MVDMREGWLVGMVLLQWRAAANVMVVFRGSAVVQMPGMVIVNWWGRGTEAPQACCLCAPVHGTVYATYKVCPH